MVPRSHRVNEEWMSIILSHDLYFRRYDFYTFSPLTTVSHMNEEKIENCHFEIIISLLLFNEMVRAAFLGLVAFKIVGKS